MAESSMALDRSSPVLGPVDQMELEVVEPGLAEPVTTSAAFVRDLDMEYDLDEAARLPAELLDHEMAQDTQDTEEKGLEQEQPLPEASDPPSSTPEVAQQSAHPIQPEDISTVPPPDKPSNALDQPEDLGTPIPNQTSLHPEALQLLPASQETLTIESTLATRQNLESTNPAEQTEEPLEDAYADAAEPHEPIASTSATQHVPPSQMPARPTLQKDYLGHIELQNAHGDAPPADLTASRFSPHVSLSYKGTEYSLFRPSSTPSGDDEEVLFSEGVDAEGGTHSLYYASLDSLIEALHQAFPTLKGDGESEILLDFGFLDIQISQDNVYCQQVSLFDLDRIRIGLCQPEFDRLQITLKPSKRFAFRFNELAEHCYRMFSGSEEDSGTIYGEDLDPLTDFTDSLAAPDLHASNLAAEALQEEQTADTAESQLDLPPSAPDDQPPGDVAESDSVAFDGAADTQLFTNLPLPAKGHTSLSADTVDEHGDVHPPTDEHYDDPEFAVSNEVEDLEEYVEEDDGDVTAADEISKDAEDDQESSETIYVGSETIFHHKEEEKYAVNEDKGSVVTDFKRDIVEHPALAKKRTLGDVEVEESDGQYAAEPGATEIDLKRPKIAV